MANKFVEIASKLLARSKLDLSTSKYFERKRIARPLDALKFDGLQLDALKLEWWPIRFLIRMGRTKELGKLAIKSNEKIRRFSGE